jgi:hypothetical protein
MEAAARELAFMGSEARRFNVEGSAHRKGRGSVAAARRRLKRIASLAPPGSIPYPQKLWTSLWTMRFRSPDFPVEIAYLLP